MLEWCAAAQHLFDLLLGLAREAEVDDGIDRQAAAAVHTEGTFVLDVVVVDDQALHPRDCTSTGM